MILADTNAWVDHLRKKDDRLVTFLLQQRVRTSDVVIGELRLGSGLPKTFAADLSALRGYRAPARKKPVPSSNGTGGSSRGRVWVGPTP